MDFFNSLKSQFVEATHSMEQYVESVIVGNSDTTTNDETTPQHSSFQKTKEQMIYYVSLGYNLTMHNAETQPWWNRVTEFVIVGALPFHEGDHVRKLTEIENVGGVLILNKNFELEPNLIGTPITKDAWEKAGVSALHIPTPDFHPPTLEDVMQGIEFMRSIVSTKKTVYVHCKAGRGRSVVATVCYLTYEHGLTTDAAVELIKKQRPQINMGLTQLQTCRDFEEKYCKGRRENNVEVVKEKQEGEEKEEKNEQKGEEPTTI
eukprot:TRINITY_DN4155_c0_g1_i1.p1 TRINITY_DN4155_c0_g1~~TRINITY_DN4155_c0_g1_i1.p1  ORF type:complete len:262 (+),score=68.46 TRINITY_DN4155_c0_g1_i1:115-900(+)